MFDGRGQVSGTTVFGEGELWFQPPSSPIVVSHVVFGAMILMSAMHLKHNWRRPKKPARTRRMDGLERGRDGQSLQMAGLNSKISVW